MDVRDGFIVGIYSYCDRWCERCAFTSHCRLFADRAEFEASQDPSLQPVVDAPPLPEEADATPDWKQALIDDMNEACGDPIPADEWERIRPRVPAEHAPVNQRAKDYAGRAFEWLTAHEEEFVDGPDDPRSVIAWFHLFIATKVHRALMVWPDEDSECTDGDRDGSAKVALLALERSHEAWLNLVGRGAIAPRDAAPFLADLAWLGEQLERIRPKARGFVRPGLDEPEAVARFLAGF